MSSETEPGYNQPIIFEAGGVRQLIIFHPSGFASPRSGDRQNLLGDRTSIADGNCGRDADQERTEPLFHLAMLAAPAC